MRALKYFTIFSFCSLFVPFLLSSVIYLQSAIFQAVYSVHQIIFTFSGEVIVFRSCIFPVLIDVYFININFLNFFFQVLPIFLQRFSYEVNISVGRSPAFIRETEDEFCQLILSMVFLYVTENNNAAIRRFFIYMDYNHPLTDNVRSHRPTIPLSSESFNFEFKNSAHPVL